MLLAFLALFSFVFLLGFCMRVVPTIVSSWVRVPYSTTLLSTNRLGSRASPATTKRVLHRRAAMLKRAMNSYKEADGSDKSLKNQQTIGSASAASARLPADAKSNVAPARVATGNILQPLPRNSLNWADQRRYPNANAAVKRTASGLAKAVNGGGHDPFTDYTPMESSTKDSNIVIEDNDFDSDVDLDVEELNTRSTQSILQSRAISTPKASVYPTFQKAQLHSQASNESAYQGQQVTDLPPSSVPLPWSSSPDFHKAPPSNRHRFDEYTYDPSRASVVAETGDDLPKPRPLKRRTLPWLQADAEEAQTVPTLTTASTPYSKNNIKSKPVMSTPHAQSTASPYPWNTTASAIKEQQKQLRKVNKVAGKANQAPDETRAGPVLKKSKAVPRPCLSQEQQHVLDLVVDQGKSVFFTGSAGTGKSVLLREIIAVLRKKYLRESDRVAITASTGLAACNVGGVTLHSFAGFGLGKEDVPELVKKIKRNQKAKHRWMRTKVLVVDEVSMVDGEMFDKLEAIARTLRNNGRPFGGIQLVVTGDFFQLPPVPDHGSGRMAKFSFEAQAWNSSIEHTIGLHHVFRQKDPKFASILNEMREGYLSQGSINLFRQLSRPLHFDDDLQATELFPTRAEVEAANNAKMRQITGDARVFEAKDGGTIVDKAARDKLLQNCMAPERLEVKVGAQVMLIKNIDEMLVNGSLGFVKGFMNEQTFDSYNADEDAFRSVQDHDETELNPKELQYKKKIDSLVASTSQSWPLVRFAMADGTTRDLLCNREQWKVELPNGEVQASRAQVPLILAWALSIHKAQGQTLDRVKVDLGKVFEKGQAYVALSRATSMNGLQVLRFDPKKVVAHERVRNFYSSLSKIEQEEADREAANDA